MGIYLKLSLFQKNRHMKNEINYFHKLEKFTLAIGVQWKLKYKVSFYLKKILNDILVRIFEKHVKFLQQKTIEKKILPLASTSSLEFVLNLNSNKIKMALSETKELLKPLLKALEIEQFKHYLIGK